MIRGTAILAPICLQVLSCAFGQGVCVGVRPAIPAPICLQVLSCAFGLGVSVGVRPVRSDRVGLVLVFISV